MRLTRLLLRKFGPFTDQAFDFSCPGVHLICGDNETGKSTTLRAVEAALYGFDHRTADDHTHQAKELEIEFAVETDGTAHELVRRKGRKHTLRTVAGEIVDDQLITDALGRVDAELFSLLFGLDSQRLRAGADAIVSAGGRLSDTIFGAGLAGTGVGAVIKDFESQAEQLYKPRGANQRIPVLLKRLSEASDTVAGATLTSGAWEEALTELQAAVARVDEREEQLAAARALRSKLARLENTRPEVHELRALRDARAALGAVAPLGGGDLSAFDQAQADARVATTTVEQRARQLAELIEEREGFGETAAWTAVAAEIAELGDTRSVCAEARRLRPQKQATLEELERQLEEAQGLLGLGANSDAPPLQERVERALRGALDDLHALEPRKVAAEEIARKAQAALATVTAALEGLAPIAATDELDAAVAAAARAGDLDAAKTQLTSRLAATSDRLEVQRRRLGLPPALDPRTLNLPTEAERVALIEERQLGEQALAQLATQRREEAARSDELEARILALVGADSVESEHDLHAARAARDDLWRLVRPVLRGEREVIALEDRQRADDYEAATSSADQRADRLRANADQLADARALEAQRLELQRRVAALDERAAATTAQQQHHQREWTRRWAAAGDAAPSPREALAWGAAFDKAVESAATKAELEAELAALGDRYDELRRRLADLLGAEAPATARPLAEWRAAAQQRLESCRDAARQRKQLESASAERSRELEEAREELAALQARTSEGQAQWRAAAQGLPFATGDDPRSTAALLDAYHRLRKTRADRDRLAAELRAEDQRFDDYDRDARRLAQPLLDSLSAAESTDAVVERLLRGREAAAADQRRATSIAASLLALSAERADADAQLRRAQSLLSELQQRAQVTTAEDFRAAAHASLEARRLDTEVERVELHLRRQAPDGDLDRLIAAVDAYDPDALAAELAAVLARVEQLELELNAANQAVGTAEEKRRARERERGAADAEQAVQDLLSELHDEVSDYVDVVVAAALLREAMKSYAERMHGPVLARASELMAALTQGSITSLIVDYGDKDEQQLFALRAGGGRVELQGLSEGTRDQLFLALRLACIEAHVEKHGPMPLVLDDIFQSFDEARTQAALGVLGKIAQSCQVLLFTHHERVAELARAALGPRLTEHRL